MVGASPYRASPRSDDSAARAAGRRAEFERRFEELRKSVGDGSWPLLEVARRARSRAVRITACVAYVSRSWRGDHDWRKLADVLKEFPDLGEDIADALFERIRSCPGHPRDEKSILVIGVHVPSRRERAWAELGGDPYACNLEAVAYMCEQVRVEQDRIWDRIDKTRVRMLCWAIEHLPEFRERAIGLLGDKVRADINHELDFFLRGLGQNALRIIIDGSPACRKQAVEAVLHRFHHQTDGSGERFPHPSNDEDVTRAREGYLLLIARAFRQCPEMEDMIRWWFGNGPWFQRPISTETVRRSVIEGTVTHLFDLYDSHLTDDLAHHIRCLEPFALVESSVSVLALARILRHDPTKRLLMRIVDEMPSLRDTAFHRLARLDGKESMDLKECLGLMESYPESRIALAMKAVELAGSHVELVAVEALVAGSQAASLAVKEKIEETPEWLIEEIVRIAGDMDV